MFENYFEGSQMIEALNSLWGYYIAADFATQKSFKQQILIECEPISNTYPDELNYVFSNYLDRQHEDFKTWWEEELAH